MKEFSRTEQGQQGAAPYIIQAGDSLSKIIQTQYAGLNPSEISQKINEIAALNGLDDPNRIREGASLLLPEKNESVRHSEGLQLRSAKPPQEVAIEGYSKLTGDQPGMVLKYAKELSQSIIPEGSDRSEFLRAKISTDLLGRGPDYQAVHDYFQEMLDIGADMQVEPPKDTNTFQNPLLLDPADYNGAPAQSISTTPESETAVVNVPEGLQSTDELIADFSKRLESGEITIRDVKQELETRNIPPEIAQQVLVCEEIAGPEAGTYEIQHVSAEAQVVNIQTYLAMSFDDIMIDGMLGPQAGGYLQESLMDIQHANGQPATGEYTPETKQLLLGTIEDLSPGSPQQDAMIGFVEALDTLKAQILPSGNTALDTIYQPQGNCGASVNCTVAEIKSPSSGPMI